MRHGRQTCEGADYHTGKYCLSLAFWRVKLFLDMRAEHTFEVFLCSTCHAMAELSLAERAIPRKEQYSEQGFEAEPQHLESVYRYRRLFADACKASLPEQMQFFFSQPSSAA